MPTMPGPLGRKQTETRRIERRGVGQRAIRAAQRGREAEARALVQSEQAAVKRQTAGERQFARDVGTALQQSLTPRFESEGRGAFITATDIKQVRDKLAAGQTRAANAQIESLQRLRPKLTGKEAASRAADFVPFLGTFKNFSQLTPEERTAALIVDVIAVAPFAPKAVKFATRGGKLTVAGTKALPSNVKAILRDQSGYVIVKRKPKPNVKIRPKKKAPTPPKKKPGPTKAQRLRERQRIKDEIGRRAREQRAAELAASRTATPLPAPKPGTQPTTTTTTTTRPGPGTGPRTRPIIEPRPDTKLPPPPDPTPKVTPPRTDRDTKPKPATQAVTKPDEETQASTQPRQKQQQQQSTQTESKSKTTTGAKTTSVRRGKTTPKSKGTPAAVRPRFRFPLPPIKLGVGGIPLGPNEYPRVATWKQGRVRVTHNFATRRTAFQAVSTPGKPRETFRVLSKMNTPPKAQRLELGQFRVLIDTDGVRFRFKGGKKLEDRTLRRRRRF